MIFHLDHRCQEILKLIINSNGYVKVQDIADQMHTSKRSAYYDIQKINDWLMSCNIPPLEQERGKGIILSTSQKETIQKVVERNTQPAYPDFTPQQRQFIEICMIILLQNNLYVEDFIQVCDVSRNTVLNDLKQVTTELSKHGLTLNYSMKEGYTIEGNPIKKWALFFLYFPSLATIFNRSVFTDVQQRGIADTLGRLKDIEHHLHAEYVSGTLTTLATFIAIMDFPKELDPFYDMDEEEIMGTTEYRLVSDAFSTLPDAEKLYVALHLLGSRLQSVPMQIMQDNAQVYHIAEQLLESFEQTSSIRYDNPDELIQAIAAHLKTSMYRYRYGIQLGNPMLENIQSEYSELFELTKTAATSVFLKYDMEISDAEIAYLTLHFGAFMTPKQPDAHTYRILIVCPNGIGTGNMIKSEVSNLVPQATEVVNIPLGQYESEHDYDVVISTVLLPQEKNQIVVHPILTDQDRVAILRRCMYSQPQVKMEVEDIVKIASRYMTREKVEEFKQELANYYSGIRIQQAPKRNYGVGLRAYLKRSHIQIAKEETDWESAIRLSCQPLLMEGSITEEYMNAIIEDQKEKGMYMFLTEGLVLAHSSSEKGVNQLDISLTAFHHPVSFLNEREAKIIITLCAEDQTKHIRILNDILHIFSKKKNIDKIAAMNSIEEIYAMINEELKEKER